MLHGYRLPLLAVFFILGGCAGFNQQECQVADWRTVGFTDGAAGRPVSAIGGYRQDCSKYGIAPNLDSYRQGYDAGVREFCTPGKGFEFGSQGGQYSGMCPADLEPAFLTAYHDGHHLYELQSALSSTNRQIAYDQTEIDRLKKATVAQSVAIISDDTKASERVALLAKTAENSRRQGELEKEIGRLESSRALQERELSDYQSTVANRF
ncbi:MAG TPA: DUF2799 domain-containing protein [Gammaproteobacteria bacterium]|nr:DUF2799 domain-containing protein [Gammaproteobacteria bacterium]